MFERDFIPVNGFYELVIKEQGEIVKKLQGKNLVTTAGMALIASRLKDASDSAPSYMGVGSSTTQPAVGQTGLIGTEHERVAGSISLVSNKWTISASFGAGISGSVTIGEFGIFNASSGGTMLSRFIIPATTVSATGTFDVNWFIFIGEQ